jgi:chaperonin cofactor prefoldin
LSAHDRAILRKMVESMKLRLKGLELDKKMTEDRIKQLKKDIKSMEWLLA